MRENSYFICIFSFVFLKHRDIFFINKKKIEHVFDVKAVVLMLKNIVITNFLNRKFLLKNYLLS